MGEILAFFMREKKFCDQSATGSNQVIAMKVQCWRSERGITAALPAFKDILRNAFILFYYLAC